MIKNPSFPPFRLANLTQIFLLADMEFKKNYVHVCERLLNLNTEDYGLQKKNNASRNQP